MGHRTQDGRIVTPSHKLGSGGEGEVFAIREDPGLAFKRYYTPYRHGIHRKKLEVMIASPPPDPTASDGHRSVAWPSAIVTDELGGFEGFLMPRLGSGSTLYSAFHARERPIAFPGFTWIHLVTVGQNMSSALAAIHSAGYVLGDLNSSNVQVTGDARVTFFDCDSIQVRSGASVFSCPVGREEYSPPEVLASLDSGQEYAEVSRTPQTDCFSLAIMLYELLFLGRHPFSGRWFDLSRDPEPPEELIRLGVSPLLGSPGIGLPPSDPDPTMIVPQAVLNLLRRAVSADVEDRPSARALMESLRDLRTSIVPCSQSAQHRFSRSLDACPWCYIKSEFGEDPFPIPGTRAASKTRSQHRNVNSAVTMARGAFVDAQNWRPKGVFQQLGEIAGVGQGGRRWQQAKQCYVEVIGLARIGDRAAIDELKWLAPHRVQLRSMGMTLASIVAAIPEGAEQVSLCRTLTLSGADLVALLEIAQGAMFVGYLETELARTIDPSDAVLIARLKQSDSLHVRESAWRAEGDRRVIGLQRWIDASVESDPNGEALDREARQLELWLPTIPADLRFDSIRRGWQGALDLARRKLGAQRRLSEQLNRWKVARWSSYGLWGVSFLLLGIHSTRWPAVGAWLVSLVLWLIAGAAVRELREPDAWTAFDSFNEVPIRQRKQLNLATWNPTVVSIVLGVIFAALAGGAVGLNHLVSSSSNAGPPLGGVANGGVNAGGGSAAQSGSSTPVVIPSSTTSIADSTGGPSPAGWGGGPLPQGFTGISGVTCSTVVHCLITGFDGAGKASTLISTDGGSSWSESGGSFPFGTGTDSVSSLTCPSVTNCVAVGGTEFAFTTNGGVTWSGSGFQGAGDALPPSITGVSCFSATSCIAVGASGSNPNMAAIDLTTNSGATWTAGSPPSGMGPLAQVSCPSTTSCVALGSGVALVVNVSASGSGNYYADLSIGDVLGISCPSTTLCVAVGGNSDGGGAAWLTDNAGASWSDASLPAGAAVLRGISCSSTAICVAVAGSGDGAGSALHTSDAGSTWSDVSLPSELDSPAGVSCPSVTQCVVVGDSTDFSSSGVAFFSTDGGFIWK
jgi:hypothetical protein